MRISKAKWQELENEFLDGELNEEEFCKLKNLDVEWFRQKLDNAETSRDNKMFVELIPELNSASVSGTLKIRFREVDFELSENFPVTAFRQALQVIREEL